jgi:FkbM family methyltransferase
MRSTLTRAGVRVISEAAKRSSTIRDGVIDALAPTTDRFRLVGRLAEELGFAGLVAEGSCGVIRGSLDDSAALLRYARDGYWAPHQRALFETLFHRIGGTYLDIGANIGLTLIPIAGNASVTCHGFEPHPTNFKHLRENVAVNCPSANVTLHNLALFDSAATLEFEMSPRHSGDHRLRLNKDGGAMKEQTRETIHVQANRLDAVIPHVRRPLGVKIDTQGAEPFVIAGGASVLAEADVLSLEFWPYSMLRMGGKIGQLTGFLAANFREGTAAAGDRDEILHWQPIESLVGFLDTYATTSVGKGDYLDVVVRK